MTPHAQDIALTVVHFAAGFGVLSVMHARGCRKLERAFWMFAAAGVFLRPLSLFIPFWGKNLELVGVVMFTVVLYLASTAVRTGRYSKEEAAQAASNIQRASPELREAIELVTRSWVWDDMDDRACDVGLLRINQAGVITHAAGGGADESWVGLALWSDVTREAHAKALTGSTSRYDDVDDGWRYMVTVRPMYDEIGEVVGSRLSFLRRRDGERG